MTDRLLSIHTRLMNEKSRLRASRTKQERELRAVWVAQIESEIRNEEMFQYGFSTDCNDDLSDDDLLSDLGVTEAIETVRSLGIG